PGYHPHPVSDSLGHSYGQEIMSVEDLDPKLWSQCRPYLRGIDLFNHGYYWEAHEAWEQIWHACGRKGETADFVKGLIQLAVAGVKVRQGLSEGVKTHGRRAEEIFNQLSSARAVSNFRFMGLDLVDLATRAREVVDKANVVRDQGKMAVAIVFPFILRPDPSPATNPSIEAQ
ncbi:MAG TPA: DUF309 domain-containing protein, partial [Gemmataceae bacterium]|nr:DUF309 domain-containing protein [Gemmataceae bacterium]